MKRDYIGKNYKRNNYKKGWLYYTINDKKRIYGEGQYREKLYEKRLYREELQRKEITIYGKRWYNRERIYEKRQKIERLYKKKLHRKRLCRNELCKRGLYIKIWEFSHRSVIDCYRYYIV